MIPGMKRLSSTILLSICLLLPACPSGDDDEADAGGTADAGSDAGTTDAGRPGPHATCAEGGFTDCFSNRDCATPEVCLNVGGDPDFVPCCVPGARGSLVAGETCDPVTGETECASSLCIESMTESRCTDVCTASTECPVGMQNCTFIAFSGSNDMWCLFE